jgi:hypothetical protein
VYDFGLAQVCHACAAATSFPAEERRSHSKPKDVLVPLLVPPANAGAPKLKQFNEKKQTDHIINSNKQKEELAAWLKKGLRKSSCHWMMTSATFRDGVTYLCCANAGAP